MVRHWLQSITQSISLFPNYQHQIKGNVNWKLRSISMYSLTLAYGVIFLFDTYIDLV